MGPGWADLRGPIAPGWSRSTTTAQGRCVRCIGRCSDGTAVPSSASMVSPACALGMRAQVFGQGFQRASSAVRPADRPELLLECGAFGEGEHSSSHCACRARFPPRPPLAPAPQSQRADLQHAPALLAPSQRCTTSHNHLRCADLARGAAEALGEAPFELHLSAVRANINALLHHNGIRWRFPQKDAKAHGVASGLSSPSCRRAPGADELLCSRSRAVAGMLESA